MNSMLIMSSSSRALDVSTGGGNCIMDQIDELENAQGDESQMIKEETLNLRRHMTCNLDEQST